MTGKICKCGAKISRKIPGTNKKTKQTRKRCYNCSPARSSHSPQPQEHISERKRRKLALVKMLGGRCTVCGYKKSVTALSLHHKDPKTKSFDISHNGNLMRDWDRVLKEAQKCELLCLNCHAEYHNGK